MTEIYVAGLDLSVPARTHRSKIGRNAWFDGGLAGCCGVLRDADTGGALGSGLAPRAKALIAQLIRGVAIG